MRESEKMGTGFIHSGPLPAGGRQGSNAGLFGYTCRKVSQNHYYIVNIQKEMGAMLQTRNVDNPA